MQRTNSTNWSIADQVSAERLQDFNEDLDTIFAELSAENLTLTYNISGQLSQVVDNENTITINLDWTQYEATPAKLMIQKVGDPKKWTINYDSSGFISTIVYA